MSLVSNALKGMAQRMEVEQSLQLQRHLTVRPQQIQLRMSRELIAVDEALAADPKLAAKFKTIKLVVPTFT